MIMPKPSPTYGEQIILSIFKTSDYIVSTFFSLFYRFNISNITRVYNIIDLYYITLAKIILYIFCLLLIIKGQKEKPLSRAINK